MEQGQPEEMSQVLSPLTVLPCPLPAPHSAGEGEGAPGSVALLSKCGDSILLGQSRGGGFLALLDAASLRCIDLVKVGQGQGGMRGGRGEERDHPL